MRRDTLSSEFSMFAGSVIALPIATGIAIGFSLVLMAVIPAALAAQPLLSNHHTQAYLQGLDQQQRSVLQASLQNSLVKVTSRDGLDAIPGYQVYHGIFLDLLMQPRLAATLPQADRDLIAALPAHSDALFIDEIQSAMKVACRVIDNLPADNPASAVTAVGAFQQARNALQSRFDHHYQQALAKLSQEGRELVAAEVADLVEQGSLVHMELDLDRLSFSQPGFATAFLRDACDAAAPVLQNLRSRNRTLQDQLTDDYQAGAVQVFQSP